MNDETASDPAARRAKVVLRVALGVFIVSQFFPCTTFTTKGGWFFRWLVDAVERVFGAPATGVPVSWVDVGLQLIRLMVNLFMLGCLAGVPWLIGWLRQGRPILWILRILMVMWVLMLGYAHYMSTKYASIVIDESFKYLAGYWLYMTALVLNAIGLWMIPKAEKRQALMTQEIPTTDEHG